MFKHKILIVPIVSIIGLVLFAFHYHYAYVDYYDKGVALLKEGNKEEAIEVFENIPNYADYRDISVLLELEECPNCHSPLINK